MKEENKIKVKGKEALHILTHIKIYKNNLMKKKRKKHTHIFQGWRSTEPRKEKKYRSIVFSNHIPSV